MAQNGRHRADETLLMALACGATVENAARAAGVGPRTVQRRLNAPEFRKRLQALRRDIAERSTGALIAARLESMKTFLALQHPTIPPAVRLGAARAVFEIGMRLHEYSEITERIAALEAQANRAGCLSRPP